MHQGDAGNHEKVRAFGPFDVMPSHYLVTFCLNLPNMDPTEAFFTQTVVGSPFTALLGRRRAPGSGAVEGLKVAMTTGESSLTRLWNEWVVLSHACDPVGTPRVRPGRIRRLLERHALLLAVLGLCSLAASLVVWGVALWK